MKTKFFAYLLLAVVFLFPFRYAYLTLTGPNVFSLLNMLATVIGVLIFILLTTSNKVETIKGNEKDKNVYQ